MRHTNLLEQFSNNKTYGNKWDFQKTFRARQSIQINQPIFILIHLATVLVQLTFIWCTTENMQSLKNNDITIKSYFSVSMFWVFGSAKASLQSLGAFCANVKGPEIFPPVNKFGVKLVMSISGNTTSWTFWCSLEALYGVKIVICWEINIFSPNSQIHMKYI